MDLFSISPKSCSIKGDSKVQKVEINNDLD